MTTVSSQGMPSQSQMSPGLVTPYKDITGQVVFPNASYNRTMFPVAGAAAVTPGCSRDFNDWILRLPERSQGQGRQRISLLPPSYRDNSEVGKNVPTTPYIPLVEPISPTSTPEDDSPFQNLRLDLMAKIAKIDKDITKTENEISRLKKFRKQRVVVKEEIEEQIPETSQNLAQKIYTENRKKAEESHQIFDKMGPPVQYPLYNQPVDATILHVNHQKHKIFLNRLKISLKNKFIEREKNKREHTLTYSRLYQKWRREVQKVENSAKRKETDVKNREIFEKLFTSLKGQMEERSRKPGINETESYENKEQLRVRSIVPPMMHDTDRRRRFFINENGRLDDFPFTFRENIRRCVWTTSEKETFKEKFLQHPKNFGLIASHLKISVSECIQYYYLSKKNENYKGLLRKYRQKSKPGRNP